MRVEERNVADQVASTASRAAESQRIQLSTTGAGARESAADGDQVDLSSLTGRISRALETVASQASQRASQLQKDYRSGRYQPDPRAIGRAMLAHWPGVAAS